MNMKSLKPLIVILGPTASGKTGLALALAKEFGGELLSADSRQIYKEMDIATNKLDSATTTEKTAIGKKLYFIDGTPIHLLDLIDPDESFSLADYKKVALKKIEEIYSKGKLPILVGGTGLYLSAIVDNLNIPKAPADEKLRAKLEEKDAEELFDALAKIDPTSAETIGPQNKRKLIRALEVYKITGQPFSSQQKKGKPLFNTLQIGIRIERQELHNRIDKRVDRMIKGGLVQETQFLRKKYAIELPAMSGIGYKEIGAYLDGEMGLEEATQQIKFHTHQYARRQITWFNRDKSINWVEDYTEAEKLVKNFTAIEV
ncbi:MAG: tRNA (adenosine(37)-N6)-dimethylallyltransferase MiaA [Candidatus Pacebacteria bacterium]|nr:tRNA (adenosine(37)-N6)-dimethylallyltransferase MiaA [Candidatus Paceibacterota bacterium]